MRGRKPLTDQSSKLTARIETKLKQTDKNELIKIAKVLNLDLATLQREVLIDFINNYHKRFTNQLEVF